MSLPPRAFLAIALSVLAGCAPQGPVPEAAREDRCVVLFRQYDDLQQWVRRRDNVTIPPELELQQLWLRQAGCITMNAALAPMASLPLVPVTDSGPVISPISLHAGVVTSDATDAEVRAFFEARGVRARSIGEAGLGRRIYIGPFATRGALEDARALALAAGFIAPYTVRF